MHDSDTTARILLRSFQGRGIAFKVRDEKLLAHPLEGLSEADRELLKLHKAALVDLVEWENKPGPATDENFRLWFEDAERIARKKAEDLVEKEKKTIGDDPLAAIERALDLRRQQNAEACGEGEQNSD